MTRNYELGEPTLRSDKLRSITVDATTKVDPRVIRAGLTAIEAVLQQNKSPLDGITVRFLDNIPDAETGRPTDIPATTLPDGNSIWFGMRSPSMRSFIETFGPIGSMLFFAAHEGRHLADLRNGEQIPTTANLSPEEYVRSKHERDANDDALHLFKRVRPHASGTFEITIRGGPSSFLLEFPEKSRFQYPKDPSSLPDYIRG